MLAQSTQKPFRYLVQRFCGDEMVFEQCLPEPMPADILANLRRHYRVEVTPLYAGPQPDVLSAIERLIAADDAHDALHADDGDDVSRMIEYAEAFIDARALIASIKAAQGAA